MIIKYDPVKVGNIAKFFNEQSENYKVLLSVNVGFYKFRQNINQAFNN